MTLIEILIAIAILIISLIALFEMGNHVTRMNRTSERISDANFVISQYAEMFKALPSDAPELKNDEDNNDLDDTTSPDHQDTATVAKNTYIVMWNVVDNRAGEDTVYGMKTIKIFVVWKNKVISSVSMARRSYE